MCMFFGITPDMFVKLDESDALIGYKTLAVEMRTERIGGAMVTSPLQDTPWHEPLLTVRNVHGGPRSVVGVYAYPDPSRARPWMSQFISGQPEWRLKVRAQVALFGKVAAYTSDRMGRTGYRAQRARVLQIQLPHGAPREASRLIKAISPEWRRVTITRREIRGDHARI